MVIKKAKLEQIKKERCEKPTDKTKDNIEPKVDVPNDSSKQKTSDLKDTDNFTDSALEHILEGQINAKGKATGYHYDGMPDTKGNIIPGTESAPNEFGVYKAQVEVDGVPKTSNGGESTFFPKDWSSQDVVNGINEAYNNKVFKSGNEYYGHTSKGIKVSMYIDTNTGKIISAFPQY